VKRHCLTLDLIDDPTLIAEYEIFHQNVWPEVLASIREAGILNMEIYRLGTRLFMIMETEDDFSFEAKSGTDLANPIVQRWEEQMWKYQKALPEAATGEKWLLMKQIFSLA
jgi:L-rhamnose mutarotase